MTYQNQVGLLDPLLTSALPKAEDSVAANGAYGIPILGVRKDIVAALADADGDWALFEFDAQGRLWVAGQVAHDSPISGAPFRIAGRARTSELTAVANDDTVDLLSDEFGKQIILPYAMPSKYIDGITAAITGTSDTAVIAAPGANLYNNILWALVTNSHATVGTVVELKSNTTVRARGYAAPAGGGFMLVCKTPIKLATNVAFNAANITTGSNTYVTAGGYISGN